MTALETTRRPTVLLTGFGSFPGVAENCSAALARDIRQAIQASGGGVHVVAVRLPVVWTTIGTHLDRLYARHTPNFALHFGVGQHVCGLHMETTAFNACALTKDAAGCVPEAETVDRNGPRCRATTLPAAHFCALLQTHNIVATVSDDAGRYLCNAAYYVSLGLAAAAPTKAAALFVHVPEGLSHRSPDWNAYVAAGTDLVALALDAEHAREACI